MKTNPPQPGDVVDHRYRIEEALGIGPNRLVFRGRSILLDRAVAIKFLQAEGTTDHTVQARFRREAQSLAQIAHPNVVTIHDFGFVRNLAYMVMEWLPGGDLRSHLQLFGAVPVKTAVRYALDSLEGLQAAHEKRVVHRDIKPGNLFLTDAGRVKVGDFGIAYLMDRPRLTNIKRGIPATPAYGAPEQFRGEAPDARTDLYAVGVCLYECLSGNVPFQADTVREIVAMHLSAPPPPSHRRSRSVCGGRWSAH